MKRISILMGCLLAIQVAVGQRSPEFVSPDRLLREGQAMFADGNYAACIDKITEYKRLPLAQAEQETADFLLVASAFHQGNGRAGADLLAFLKTYPQTGHRNELCFMIGSVFYAENDYETADYWLSQSRIEALPEAEQADYAYRRGMIHLHENHFKVADRFFSLLHGTKYGEASDYYRAYIAYKEGDYEQALSRFTQIRDRETFQPDVLYYIAQIYFVQGHYAETIREGLDLLNQYADHPYSTEIQRITGVSYYQQSDYNRAIQYLRPLADREPLPAEWSDKDAYALGVSCYQTKNYEDAVRYLSLSNPGRDAQGQSAYLYLGQSLLRLNRTTDALRAFESASRITADASAQEAATYNYAMLLHQTASSGFGESVTALEQFINTYPNSVYSDRVNDALVDVYLTTKNYDTALASIAKIRNPGRKIMESKQKIYYYLGTVDLANSQYESAIDRFTQAIAVGDYAGNEKRQALYWRGESHYLKGDYFKAAADYRSFLATAAGSEWVARAHYGLGYCSFKQADYPQAETHFKTFISREKEDTPLLADAQARLGDIYFHNRRFREAEQAYGRAVETFAATADYALFQKACVMGLQKNYSGKITHMEQLISSYPQSPYVPDALYEKGRAYVLSNNFSAAIETFGQLQATHSDNPWARNAGLQMGLLYYNTNRLAEAAQAYKDVIAAYPGSEEAKVALQDLKSVYFDLNDLTGYVDYVRTLGDQSLEAESIRYSEEAVGRKAETHYNAKQYAEALPLYEQLQTIATGKTNRTIGALGALRSAQQLRLYPNIIAAADQLLNDETLKPEWAIEARYARAKALLNQGDRASAEPDLEILARDTRTVQGAEARYLLAQHYFDAGSPTEAHIVIQDYIQQGTPHAYWLARSYILLSDIYAAEGDRLQARQYLESLQSNYKQTNDDIHATIKERLNQLK